MDVNDELLCIADTKLVMGNWFAECVMNGRSLPDFAALLGICTASYGQTRAIYQHVAAGLDAYSHLERGRGASELRSMQLLDEPPANWEDFVLTVYLAEQATWTLMTGFLKHPDRTVAALARKMGEEAYFHLKYATGWFQVSKEDGEATQRLAESLHKRYPLARDWFGPVDAEDNLHANGGRAASLGDLAAGFDDIVNSDVAKAGLSLPGALSLTGEYVDESWDGLRRRRGDMPAGLFEIVRFKHPELAH